MSSAGPKGAVICTEGETPRRTNPTPIVGDRSSVLVEEQGQARRCRRCSITKGVIGGISIIRCRNGSGSSPGCRVWQRRQASGWCAITSSTRSIGSGSIPDSESPGWPRACSHLEGGHRCAEAIRLDGVAGTQRGTPRSPAAAGLQDREGRRLPLLVGSHPFSTDPRSVVMVGEAIPLGMAPAGGDRNLE